MPPRLFAFPRERRANQPQGAALNRAIARLEPAHRDIIARLVALLEPTLEPTAEPPPEPDILSGERTPVPDPARDDPAD